MCVFFPISMANKFSETKIYYIFFTKTSLFSNLKKWFFKMIFLRFFLSSVFISIYGFKQACWSNLMILCTFSILIHDSMFVLNFLNFLYSCRFPISFSNFSIFILSAKKTNYCEGYVNCQNIEHQLRENILHHYHHYSFLWNLY